ncbi:MAG: hypothetical protein O2931_02465 [Planctomycetota bacterium]|nr:hypothetical protein [Planctomycetota bacterium]MDA1177638.1 hypothetical protein [Planctomycetota bacterium]
MFSKPDMRAPRFILWSWPGLHSLWQTGHVFGLVQAIAFTVLFDVVVLSSFVWPGWLDVNLRHGLWLALLGYWGLSFWSACRKHENVTRSGDPGALFMVAQDEYLKGDWYGAERTLQKILRWQPLDVEARLLLATLLRHTLRLEEARLELRRIQKIAYSSHWQPELAREWSAIERLASDATEDVSQVRTAQAA